MNIIPLGTGGFIPTYGKETASYLIILNTDAILLDAGTGIKRINSSFVKKLLKNVEQLHVVFSHLHHDHTCGFTWLLRLWNRKLSVYVPSDPLVDFNGLEAIKTLTNSPFFALDLLKWPNIEKLSEIKDNTLKIANWDIEIIPQIHSGGSIGIRIGDFSYITDTEPRSEIINFIKNSKLVFMDTMHDLEDFSKLDISGSKRAEHGHSEGNAIIATKALIEKLGLIHIDPLYNEKRLKRLLDETRSIFKNSLIPKESEIYKV